MCVAPHTHVGARSMAVLLGQPIISRARARARARASSKHCRSFCKKKSNKPIYLAISETGKCAAAKLGKVIES